MDCPTSTSASKPKSVVLQPISSPSPLWCFQGYIFSYIGQASQLSSGARVCDRRSRLVLLLSRLTLAQKHKRSQNGKLASIPIAATTINSETSRSPIASTTELSCPPEATLYLQFMGESERVGISAYRGATRRQINALLPYLSRVCRQCLRETT